MSDRGCCMRCGQVLFVGDQVEIHIPSDRDVQRRGSAVACTSVFLQELPEHMIESVALAEVNEGEAPKTEGKLRCPKCNARVGHWNWSGLQCSCGTWVTPAFQITNSKVDLKTDSPPASLVAPSGPTT